MKIPLRLLLPGALLLSAASCFAAAGECPVGIDQMALDGHKRILSFSKSWTDRLAVFENGQWREMPISPAGKPAQPRGVLSLRDGRVASVWNSGKGEWILAILEDDRVVRTIKFPWGLDSWDFFEMAEDSGGRIWLTAGLPEVVRCDPASGAFHIYDLGPLDTGPPKKKWNNIFLTADLRGGLWLWSADRADNYISLPRPVRVTGDSLEMLPAIPGYTGRHLEELSVRDKDSLWLGTRSQGLFLLNLDSLVAEPVPAPEKNAFDSFDGIFPFGKGWLVLAGSGSGTELWQFADEKWIRRPLPAPCHFLRWNRPMPAYLDLKSGAILAAENGILFVPHNAGEAKLLDWRSGWTLTGASQFLSLGGDRFAALSRGGSPPRWLVADLQEHLTQRPQADAVEILPWRGWAVDSQDRVFSLLEEKAADLSVWENGSWRKIRLPAELKNDRLSHVELDSSSRIWLFCDEASLPVGILSADLKEWETFPDFATALLKHREDLGEMGKELWWLRPVTGPGGGIAFRTQNWQIVHWDGLAWRTWKIQDMGSFPKDDRVSTPFFDQEGHLCVNTLRSDKTWKLGADQKWSGVEKVPGIADMWTNNLPRITDRKLPDGFMPVDIRDPWVATDNNGMTWVAGNGNLFKSYKGRTAAMFDGKAVHPFLRNPPVYSARVDRFGNAWFQLGIDSIQHILLPAKNVRPPTLALTTDRWGLTRLDSLPEGTLEWRLDRGDWQTIAPGGGMLGFLPSGDHELEFQILTSRLDRIGPIPKKVSVSLSSTEQVGHLIQLLQTGPDALRETAVQGLSRQTPLAIPALNEALKSTDSWWLQAALQECRRAASDVQKSLARPVRRSGFE